MEFSEREHKAAALERTNRFAQKIVRACEGIGHWFGSVFGYVRRRFVRVADAANVDNPRIARDGPPHVRERGLIQVVAVREEVEVRVPPLAGVLHLKEGDASADATLEEGELSKGAESGVEPVKLVAERLIGISPQCKRDKKGRFFAFQNATCFRRPRS